MPGWLGFYAHDEDAHLLHRRLNEDPEIAFILQDGPGHWRAVERTEELQGKTMLWHVPGGPLPLLGRGAGEPDVLIGDAFAGWRERRAGLDYSVPYFGPSWPSALLLELYTPGWRGLEMDLMPLSGLSYFGDYPGRNAQPTTRRWWRRMRDWMRRHAVLITRGGPLTGPHADVWALPAALRAIQSGLERDESPLTLFPKPPRRGHRLRHPLI
jgi:hypothetical protein